MSVLALRGALVNPCGLVLLTLSLVWPRPAWLCRGLPGTAAWSGRAV
jgi:hypothetical protein